ncbi:MAG: hypothetical protein OXG47_01935 [bacterium]|nr:hypothetical protein [bacterium]
MEISQLEFIIAAASMTGTILAAVLGAFAFLHREMRDCHKRMDRQDEKLADLRVAVARIEGHLGIGLPGPEQRAEDESPDRAA